MTEKIPSNPELANSLYEEIFMPALAQAIKTSLEDKGARIIDVINAMANAYAMCLSQSIGAEHAAGLMRQHADELEKSVRPVS
ncbi:hypothetical protein [Roseospira visakhapatnamensis]|uniref:Uncharacterized protein n=1 Tax=Roseospira visakhapatnamensis TaxID=390880 RepID=A0A7W6WAD2_9PROT|nr:hypothetical protein [Roseospira visakhapatnamensis]MBB4267065.1 hypothetical protein [Roseospira visakhapatnamensis]